MVASDRDVNYKGMSAIIESKKIKKSEAYGRPLRLEM